MPQSRSTHPVIALLTDFGADSFYVGAMRAAVLRTYPDARIVDVTHAIRPFSVDECSFVLARVFDMFAPGTVFLTVVDPGVGGRRRNLVVELGQRFVVSPDNGIVTETASTHGIERCYSVQKGKVARKRRHEAAGRTFLGRDIFAVAAAALASGNTPATIGSPVKKWQLLDVPEPRVRKGSIAGTSRYVDPFGNIITNISSAHLARAFGDFPHRHMAVVVDGRIVIEGIGDHFSQAGTGALMALVDSWNLLEIAVNGGRAIDRFKGLARIDVEVIAQ
jgi:S-adenosylmethionine hydrolase